MPIIIRDCLDFNNIGKTFTHEKEIYKLIFSYISICGIFRLKHQNMNYCDSYACFSLKSYSVYRLTMISYNCKWEIFFLDKLRTCLLKSVIFKSSKCKNC